MSLWVTALGTQTGLQFITLLHLAYLVSVKISGGRFFGGKCAPDWVSLFLLHCLPSATTHFLGQKHKEDTYLSHPGTSQVLDSNAH